MKRDPECISARLIILLSLSLLFSAGLTAQPLITKDLPQYLLSDFTPAEIRMKDGSEILLNMNYNTVTGKMVFIKSGRLFDMVNPQSVDSVFIQLRVFVPYDTVFLELITDGTTPFFIQHIGEISLRSKPSMSGTAQVSASNYYSGNKSEVVYFNEKLPGSFVVKSSANFWVRVNGSMINYSNERQLLKIFPKEADRIKLFIKEADLKIGSRADLIKIADYCNSIIK